MLVADISDELCEQSGLVATGPRATIFFKRLSRAIQFCAKQGLFDAQQFYLELNVQDGSQLVILPREVLTPIAVNLNKKPAFSRTRLYEFSLSGPGEQSGGLVGWQWAEMLYYPLLAFLPSVGSQLSVQGDPSDDGKNISFFGLDVNGNEINETITLNHTLQSTNYSYAIMRRVKKDVTLKRLPVYLSGTTDIVANYYADETNPQYRVIKLSKKASAIRMLFKCVTLEVRSLDDYIPLDSHDAVLYAFRAVNLALNSESAQADEIKKFQDMAVAALQDEQKSRNAATELAAANQVQPAFNLNTNNRDSLIAADVIDDVFEIFGPIGLQKAFDRITDAIELGNNKSSSWEASEGYADLDVGKGGKVTLPRTIYRPIKIRAGRGPLMMRNRYFEFHLNGFNEDCWDVGYWPYQRDHGFWDDRGKTVTVNEPETPFRLVAINDLDDDDGASITVYGYDQDGKWIRTPNNDLDDENQYIDGYKFEANYSNTLPDQLSPVFSRITRITRKQTNGYQQLLAYTIDGDQEPILIGYYYPDETEPNYSRIILPRGHGGDHPHWIRMRYRKRSLKVSCLTDNLHLSSRLAVVEFLRAIKARADNPQDAEMHEQAGLRMLQEAESAGNPSEQTISIEIASNFQDCRAGQF
jgi:hypothetical protein